MSAVLDQMSAERLVKICGLFSSEHDGERAAAAAKADGMVRANGLTWGDVITRPTPKPSFHDLPWQRMLTFCHARLALLSPHERDFIRSLMTWRGMPTPKQLDWLSALYARLCVSEAA